MANILQLFPARVRFTNADGTLTPEAFRALQALFERVGGSFGDVGEDVFGQQFAPSESGAGAGVVDATVWQPPQPEAQIAMESVLQPQSPSFVSEMLFQGV